ncbi:hypothetical protein BJY01DRAFT_241588 [Aspergillus pseudoustus]|uniref:BTB domain-containing protein n=1 Tax=Aspergillus pseudoustus TaxID=1810923 RepID=A0ABR4IBW1_9EURO
MDAPTHIVDPDGEVNIILSNANAPLPGIDDEALLPARMREKHSDKVSRIQVSAKHLILASPVLKTLLTGGWKENVTLLEKGSVEITAESWDLDALLIVLWIIHGKDSLVSRVITLEMFAKIALIVDYYECSEAMGLVYWMWISWALRLPEIFKETTSIAMSTSNHPIPHLGFPIPDGVIETAIGRLFSLIHETNQELLSRRLGCNFECSAIMYGALTMQIQDTLLSTWPDEPFDRLTYEKLRPEVARIQPPRWYSEVPRVFWRDRKIA